MADRQDIWHHLKDHEALPPQEVFDRLRQRLEEGNDMERLQRHEVTPPAFLGRRIEERVGIRPQSLGKVRWYMSAAACLVLMVVGWMVYRGNTAGPRVATVDKKQPAIQKGPASLPVSDTLFGQKDTSAALAGKPAKDAYAAARDGISVHHVFSVGGQAVPVADNDLLATFTSFIYPDVPAYLTRNTDKPLKIDVDQYTSLYISRNMLDMMKETYQVLPNGKPARRARRMKRRLDNWKEKDQKRFDKGSRANPLDPVDLAEFIFK
jgi:hypothetical protein